MTLSCNGFYDLHVHPAPDVVPRKFTDIELAERMEMEGFGGFVLKNHFSETASRAAMLQILYPKLVIRGGVVLNRTMGGMNP